LVRTAPFSRSIVVSFLIISIIWMQAILAILILSAPSILQLHFQYTCALCLLSCVSYIIIPLAYGQNFTMLDLSIIFVTAVIALFLSSNKSKQSRVEFYDRTVKEQEFTMLKSELGVKKKKTANEDFINSPMQRIVSMLKGMLENLPPEQQETLNYVIEVCFHLSVVCHSQHSEYFVSGY
jgi:hypothetical protein